MVGCGHCAHSLNLAHVLNGKEITQLPDLLLYGRHSYQAVYHLAGSLLGRYAVGIASSMRGIGSLVFRVLVRYDANVVL